MNKQELERRKAQLNAWALKYWRLVAYYIRNHYQITLDDVEDLTQEVFKRAWRNMKGKSEMEPIEYPKRWLLKIADNVCKRTREEKSRLPELIYLGMSSSDEEDDSLLVDQLPDNEYDQPERKAEEREAATIIYEGLGQLSPEEQQAIHLHYFTGWTYKEISQATGKAESTIGRDARNGIQQLHDWYQAREDCLIDNGGNDHGI